MAITSYGPPRGKQLNLLGLNRPSNEKSVRTQGYGTKRVLQNDMENTIRKKTKKIDEINQSEENLQRINYFQENYQCSFGVRGKDNRCPRMCKGGFARNITSNKCDLKPSETNEMTTIIASYNPLSALPSVVANQTNVIATERRTSSSAETALQPISQNTPSTNNIDTALASPVGLYYPLGTGGNRETQFFRDFNLRLQNPSNTYSFDLLFKMAYANNENAKLILKKIEKTL